MKKEKDILNLTTRKMAAMISLLVLIGIAFLLTFNAKMKTEVDKQIGVHLKELTEQAAAQIEIEMGKCVEGVESLAIYLGSTDIKIDKNLEPFLEMVADRTSVTRISVITSDGWVFSSAGFESSPSVYKGAQETLQGKSGITGIFTSSLTGERAISIYRPLVRDGQIIAAICGTVEFKDLEKILSFSGFNGQGYSYIFQRNGDVITWSEHPNMVSLKHNVINFLKGNAVDVSTTLEEFEKRIKNGEPGYLEYKFQGKARKVYYAPIAFEDWYILSIVPEQVIKDRSEELKFYAVELTLKIIAIYIGFYLVALAWSKKNTKHLEEAHYLAVKSNKRYEIAMKHTKCYMLEYDILSDRIISLSKGTNELLGLAPRMSHDKVAKVIFSKLKIESCVVLKDFIRAFGQNDEERDCELELKSNRWIRFSASYVTKFGEKLLIGVVEDITEKKRVEAQYIQEEQIFQAMLSEAIFGFSLDLQEGKVISYFQNGQETKSGSSLSLSTDEMLIENICSYIHPEFREKAIKLFNAEELLRIQREGIEEVRDFYKMLLPETHEEVWVYIVIHLLKFPTNGHHVAFAYIKNATEEQKKTLEFKHKSERDGLTDLYNRITFEHKANEILKNLDESQFCALFMMDLDGFKVINDRYGHQTGDKLLCRVASVLEGFITAPNLTGRLGGDEFVAMVYGNGKEGIINKARKVCKEIEKISYEGEYMRICTISVGVVFSSQGDTFEKIYPKADKALYVAKKQGKNQVCILDNSDTNLY